MTLTFMLIQSKSYQHTTIVSTSTKSPHLRWNLTISSLECSFDYPSVQVPCAVFSWTSNNCKSTALLHPEFHPSYFSCTCSQSVSVPLTI